MFDLKEPHDLKNLAPTLEPVSFDEVRSTGTRRVRRRQVVGGASVLAVAAVASVMAWNGLGQQAVPANSPSGTSVAQTPTEPHPLCSQTEYTYVEFGQAFEVCEPKSFQGKTINGDGVPALGETFISTPMCVEPPQGQTAPPCPSVTIVTHRDGRVGVEVTDARTGATQHYGAPMR